MTTELPSGASSTAEKLTELKNSSRVSFGFVWASTKSAQLTTKTITTAAFWVRIRVPSGKKVYTTADSAEATVAGTPSANLLRGLSVLESFIQRLAGVRNGLHNAPTIIVIAKSGSRRVMRVAGIECGAEFVHRDPPPGEGDIGDIALFADACDCQQFPSRHRNAECGLVPLFW